MAVSGPCFIKILQNSGKKNHASCKGRGKMIFQDTANVSLSFIHQQTKVYRVYCRCIRYIFKWFQLCCFSHAPIYLSMDPSCMSFIVLLHLSEEQSSPNYLQTQLSSPLTGVWHHHRHNFILTILWGGEKKWVTITHHMPDRPGTHRLPTATPVPSCLLHLLYVSVSVTLSLPFLPSEPPSSFLFLPLFLSPAFTAYTAVGCT